MALDREGLSHNRSDEPTTAPSAHATEDVAIEYVRRAYERAIDWYKVAEAKAQLLLTVNGALVTVVFGILAGRISEAHEFANLSGAETWVFLVISTTSLVGAITCAAACLWSWHVRNIKETFAQFGVNPDDPATYRPEVLWYFGHLARLRPEAAAAIISRADRSFESQTLSYNLIHLAGVVLRKHRLVNTGWALIALTLISLVASGASIFLRTQV